MTRGEKIFIWIAFVVVFGIPAGIILIAITRPHPPPPPKPVTITGAVLRQDSDPRKQQPIANAEISVSGGNATAYGKSDVSGLFRVTLRPGITPGETITVKVESPDYKPFTVTEVPRDQLWVVRLVPILHEANKPSTTATTTEVPSHEVAIRDVKVRYSVKFLSTQNVGFASQTFEVVNTGNVPCKGRTPCSPDGKWKAAIGSVTLDAGDNNEFRNPRISCIAGPCPFTKIESGDVATPARKLTLSALDWSDTATFLVEAEVTHTMVSDMVRQAYPAVFGNGMSFTLPAAAEGPSLEAELDKDEIVFPLGPELILSWATCQVELTANKNKIFRCELKPGYVFKK
jgi:hypothetical protein